MLTVVYKSNQLPVETQPLSGTSAHVSFSTTLPIGQTYFWNVGSPTRRPARAGRRRTSSSRSTSAAPDEPVAGLAARRRRPASTYRRRWRRRSAIPAADRSTSACRCARARRAGVHDHRAARHAALLGGVPGHLHRRRRSGSSTTRRPATSSSSPTRATSSSTTAGDRVGARQHQHEPARRRGALRHGTRQPRPADDALQPVLPVHALPGPAVVRRPLSGHERQQLPVVLGRRHGLRDRAPGRSARRPAAVAWAIGVFKALSEPHRDHDDARVPERVGAAHARTAARSTQYLWDGLAVPQSESALHAERPRARRVAADRHR